MAVTDRQIFVALAALISTQVGETVTPVRVGRALSRGLARLNEQQFATPQANRWNRTNADGSRNYMARITGQRTIELHCWPGGGSAGPNPGAVLHVYAGTPDATGDSPIDGLTWYYQEPVDPTQVTDDASAWAWLTARVATGLPAAPA